MISESLQIPRFPKGEFLWEKLKISKLIKHRQVRELYVLFHRFPFQHSNKTQWLEGDTK